MGGTLFQPKSAFIACEADVTEVERGGEMVQLVTLFLKDGDPFHFVGQQPPLEGSEVLLKVFTPDGKIVYPDASSISGPLYGKRLIIYPNSTRLSTQCDYIVAEDLPPGNLRDLVQGTWKMQLIDMDANILITGGLEAEVTEGSMSYSRIEGSPGLGCIYRADCSALCPSTPGGTPGESGPPENMTYLRFDGNDYVTYPDDPSLAYTGDLGVSLWIKPSQLGTNWQDSSKWMQLIGKGIQTSSTQENKNYDVYLIGKRLYFEWDDRVTNQHYHVMTNSDAVTTTADWSYINVVVDDGEPALYVNGVEQPYSYYQSNVPGQNLITDPSQYPVVNLKDNDNPLIMGKQLTDLTSNQFYYKGDMGNFALYNRGMSEEEILNNYQQYFA